MALPFLTADVPGSGGVFKASPEDFEVEELPAYLPNGLPDGEHGYLWVEKRGRSTPEVAKLIARHVGLSDRDVSWAGLKDKQAVTRQWLSLPFKALSKLEGFSVPGVTVLERSRHRNKLKSGHLKGNRFTLTVRGVRDVGAAKASFEQLVMKGLPNAFGDQRFGARGDNAERGRAILLAGGRHRDRFERKLFLSAYQSALFNRVLGLRLECGLFAQVLKGDVLQKHESGGSFWCDDVAIDQPRADAFEVSPTGPMFGPEMRAPRDDAQVLETEVLSADGVTLDTFKAGGDETKGTRRFLRVRLGEPEFEANGEVVRLKFSLPAGSYATVVLRELLKPVDDAALPTVE
ncbi:MAG: tRNA pseudouridine(13) synthase TruD [Myxococcaceae bacterium]|nr:tRNA pseudouridine(13) synthase TruD [Myxococcaceae bacterium]